ncbi:MAG: hypothetical protein KME40_17890 [Komarekiella atlantica HA4396-MV6]|jgi:hypothetical protein|nr:hypothetical protein [Komarekiella atlantica HA4396-MV6]
MAARGIPKTGTRKPGGGRKKKFDSPTVRKRMPVVLAEKIDDIYPFLLELDAEITKWEQICEEKSTSPRYEQARKLVSILRGLLNRVGINTAHIYANNKQNSEED